MNSYNFGSTTISKVKDTADLRAVLNDSWLHTSPVVIKPNWVSEELADFTDATTLQMLFEALDTRIIVTETHMILRHGKGKSFMADGKEVNWQWLQKGDGWNWLIHNPGWEWFIEGGHWDFIQEEEQRFLDRNGFTDLFDKYDVTYINVTDEIWNGRIAAPEEVKKSVEARFNPVVAEELYGMVPQKLHDYRGSTFISLAKRKMYASFTIKNLFGMIPDPCRPHWHGPENARIARNIVDINKIYHSLFNMVGICEALSVTGIPDPQGEYEGTYSGRYNVIEGPGLVVHGRDLVSLDGMLLELTKETINNVHSVNQVPIDLAEQEINPIDQSAVVQAKAQVGNWFSYLPQAAS